MAESEKFTLELDVKASGAVKELENVEKAANKAEEGLEGLKDTGEVSGNALVSSLKRLAGTFGLVLSAGAVVSFIKRVSEANLLLGQMAVRSGQSEKSIRAMHNQFKALGYSASEANSIVDDLAGSFAALKFGGELTGITKAFASLGVVVMDAQGKARDLYDMAIEAGEFALRRSGGDRQDAMSMMMAAGMPASLADMATRSDAREQAESLKRQAAASREMAASTAKLSGAMTEMENALTDSVLKINENFGLFDGLGNAVSAMVPAVRALTDVILQIGKIFTSLKNIAQAAFAPVLEKFKEFGESVDKKIKSGENTGILGYFAGVGETGNTDYQYDADQVRQGASGSATDNDLRERIKENLKKREGVRLKAYQDSGGVWTIGYGHTKGVKPGMTITKEQADAYLEQDMKTHVDAALDLYANHSDKTKMLAADLAYNAGIGAIQPGSRFSKLAQAGEISASDYSKLYTTSKGVFTPGLVNRRNATYAEASRTPNVIMPRVQPAAYSAAPATTQVSQSSPTVTQNITVYAPSTEASEIVAEIRNRTQNIGALTSVFV